MSYVYFALCRDTLQVKIGTASDPIRRINALRTARDVKLLGVLSGGRHEEQKLHERFARQRRHGEWFTLSEDLKKLIRVAEVCLVVYKLGGNVDVAEEELMRAGFGKQRARKLKVAR